MNSPRLTQNTEKNQKPDLEDIWTQATRYLENSSLNPAAYTSWIRPLIPYRIDNNNLLLLAKNEHIQATVTGRYLIKIAQALKVTTGLDFDVRIIQESDIVSGGSLDLKSQDSFPTNLRSRYIFENFVKGRCNEFAYAASVAVADEPGTLYNPLFLHGDVGLGKTHLMHSIGNHILSIEPDTKVLYTTAENLMNEFVASIRLKRNQEFREKYRTIDVLLVDDIQFLSDKEGIQEEFFHTFNQLHGDSRQIVLTSDKGPFELKSLEGRLRSRFGSGLIVDVTLPDLETRIAILQKKAELDKVEVDSKVIYYIAKSVSSNIRELEGALNTITARAKLTGGPVSLDYAQNALDDMIQVTERHEFGVEYIQEVVGNYMGVSTEEIRSKKRNANITQARHIAMYLSRNLIHKPLKEIGKHFGNRHHSTIIHACDKIAAEIEANEKFSREIAELKRKIKGE